MYNLNIPSTLKAYIDQIVRAGKTFGIGEGGYIPLVHGKKMLVFTARGGNFSGPMAAYDFQEPYLRAIFGFIGITDITFVHAQPMNFGPEAREEALAKASERIQELLTTW